jgi:hypothetical protein
MIDDILNFDADDTLTQNIAPQGLNHAPVGLKSKFFPWHKPRKHWLRVNQWNESIVRLISALNLNANTRPLDYLSLPGPDLLDVRAIQPICATVNVKLRFLGLNYIGPNEKDVEVEQALSISEVHAMSHIDVNSTVEMDRFEHIGVKNSVAHSRIIKNGKSFDVVNIDLCGSLAATAPGKKDPSYYTALFELLRHQAVRRADDWLFFLTTRNNRDMVHSDTISKFVDGINSALKDDTTLRDTLILKKIFADEAFVDGFLDSQKLDSRSFANSFLLGVGNWIVHTLLDHNPKWKVSTLPVYGYHVADQSSECDMMSLGFYCSRVPEPAVDSHGLSGSALNTNVQTPQQVAEGCFGKLVGRLENQTDIDVKLFRDPAMYRATLETSIELLRSARYKEDEYRVWVDLENQKLINFLSNFGLI